LRGRPEPALQSRVTQGYREIRRGRLHRNLIHYHDDVVVVIRCVIDHMQNDVCTGLILLRAGIGLRTVQLRTLRKHVPTS
jgi:hypothetical protein